MDSGRVVYMNDTYVTETEARISIFDSALMFGDMVFEMTRSFNKQQFKLREHLARLYNGINILRIPLEMTIDEMENECYETIKRNDAVFEDHDEHRLMINVSRGPLGIYSHVFDGRLEPTVVIADFPLKWTIAGMGDLFDTGINAVITHQQSIPAHLSDPKIKNRSRIHLQLANIEASNWEGENNWALLTDPDGFITEGTAASFFIIKNNTVLTPEGRNILRSISREYIFELCDQLGLECIEKNLEPYDVYTADEAFMAATPFCMLPVTSLNHLPIGHGKMGDVTKKLLSTWSENVGVDIIRQTKDYTDECRKLESASSSPYQFKS